LIDSDLSQARLEIQHASEVDSYLVEEHREIITFMRQGKLKQAHKLANELLTRRPYSPRGRYNLACILSRAVNSASSAGKKTELLHGAQEALVLAIKYGFLEFARKAALGQGHTRESAIDQISNDPDLGSLFAFKPELRVYLSDKTMDRLFGAAHVPSYGAGYDDGCIEASMPVDMSDGSVVPIQQVAAGSRLLSWDQERKVATEACVSQVREHIVRELVIINGSIRVTPFHPMLTPAGWCRAVELQPDAHLVSVGGKPAVVASKDLVKGEFQVFDLSVLPTRTLSIRGIVVHNDKF
jgi:hypothetical protein